MDLIEFKHAVVAQRASGELLLALLDGDGAIAGGRCVGILLCSPEAIAALCANAGSLTKKD